MDRSSKQKIKKETQVLNDILDEMDLIDIFRAFHPNAEEYPFFSSVHGTFSRIDHILGHISNHSKFKKIEIVWSIFSDHNAMRLDINYNKTVRNTSTWRFNNMFLNKKQVTEEIKRGTKKVLETNDNENTTTQNLWDVATAVLREKFIEIQFYLKKQEKHWIDNLTLHLKRFKLEKEQKTPKISRRKEIIRIWAEINEKEMKERVVKINKIKSWLFEKINKIDKPLARLIKKKKRIESNQQN